jgi:membrane protein implicated in regulation of membrane protease activity
MDFLFYHFNSWFWLGTTCLLFFIEILTGTGFLLCLGTSAALMTAISFLFGTFETSTQMIMFSFFAILTLVYWIYYLKQHPSHSGLPKLNKRAQQYIGREFSLEENLVNGMGKIKVDDSVWLVRSDEHLKPHTAVKVIAVDGTVLIIGKVK